MRDLDSKRRKLYCILEEMLAVKYKQFGTQTECSYRDEGWVNGEYVFKECYRDLILSSNFVYFRGYEPGWLARYDSVEEPQWAEIISDNVTKTGCNYGLRVTPEVVDSLYEFWLEPGILIPKTGGRFARPAKVVMEFDVSAIPVKNIMKVRSVFGSVSNPWAAGFESVGAWIRKQYEKYECVYLVHRGLGDIRFFGCEKSIRALFQRFMFSGLAEEIEEHAPGFWDDDFNIMSGETIQQAAERLFNEI